MLNTFVSMSLKKYIYSAFDQNSSSFTHRNFSNKSKWLKKKFQNMILICFFILLTITDDNTNITEINSINNNYNVTLIKWLFNCTVQATSVSSEQIFSVAKHTISPTRNQLSIENIRASKTWYEADIIKNCSKNQ